MDDEKKMILKMLQDGKITADEAAELLDAIDEKETSQDDEYREKSGESLKTNNENVNSKINYNEIFNEDFHDKLNKKINIFANQKIGEKASELRNKINDGINKLYDNNIHDYSSWWLGANFERQYKIDKFEGNSSIVAIGKNGKIEIEGWNNDHTEIILRYYSRHEILDDNSLYNYTDKTLSISPLKGMLVLSMIIYVPQLKYNNIKVETLNGKIKVKQVECNEITCNTSNSKIEIENIESIKTKLYTSNAKIEANELKSQDVILSSSNGKIVVSGFKSKTDIAKLDIRTSNSSIDIDNMDKDCGITFNLTTSNGKCKVGLESMFSNNDNNHASGKTQNYDESNKKIEIIASTSNSNINLL